MDADFARMLGQAQNRQEGQQARINVVPDKYLIPLLCPGLFLIHSKVAKSYTFHPWLSSKC